jgi:ACS family hexuronate transporter-like MFS transporter
MLNYMDRLTLNLTAKRIMEDFRLNERDYGQLESEFAWAFAIGAILFGWMADRWSVRWIYPVALLAWSAAGFATGLATGFVELLVFRFLLGLAEAGNWPCALRTTQHIVPPSQRTLGNSILQSGAAFGAILTPMIVLACFTWTDTWRYPFMIVGGLGIFWIFVWLASVRGSDLPVAQLKPGSSLIRIVAILVLLLGIDVAVHAWCADRRWLTLLTKVTVTVLGVAVAFLWLRHGTRDDTALPRPLFLRRYGVLMVLVVTLNSTWHFLRAWLPLFLQKAHGYSEEATSWFLTAYYVVTDVGCLAAGFVTLYLIRRGLPVHSSRLVVFCSCAVATTLTVAVAFLPSGPLLIGLLLVIGFAALGLFPNYYTFSQEITVQYQGKVTGALGCTTWLAMSLLHELVGDSIKETGSYTLAMALAGLLPLIGVGAMVLFWGKTEAHLATAVASDEAGEAIVSSPLAAKAGSLPS